METPPVRRSPFPGMDPYLERSWGDMHGSVIFLAKQAMARQLAGSGLVVRSEERVYVDKDEEATRRKQYEPDLEVVEFGIRDYGVRPATGGVALAEPVTALVEADPRTERYIEIRDYVNDAKLVTLIEVLSPANKRSESGREAYLRKQAEAIDARASLVEIDLLRARKGDERPTYVGEHMLPRDRRGAYFVSVYRAYAGRFGRKEGYGISLRNRLPAFRVPLRAGDEDLVLDLQPLVDAAYEVGCYGYALDYARVPEPPLDADDEAWADALLRAAGKR